jgi:hypothetical protein
MDIRVFPFLSPMNVPSWQWLSRSAQQIPRREKGDDCGNDEVAMIRWPAAAVLLSRLPRILGNLE